MVQTLKRREKCLGEMGEMGEMGKQCRDVACYVWKLDLERRACDLLDSRL
jgi:hypothetical protein